MATSPTHDALSIDQAIGRLAEAIYSNHQASKDLILLGIANGGIVLAQRLAGLLTQSGLTPIVGTIDISFHRDDIGANPIPKEFSPTIIPRDVNGTTVILVDDVLHSGRTVKAALDELFDHGRPSCVELAVLIDRGGRKLPIAADYAGLTLEVDDSEKISVLLNASQPSVDSVRVLAATAKTSSTRVLES